MTCCSPYSLDSVILHPPPTKAGSAIVKGQNSQNLANDTIANIRNDVHIKAISKSFEECTHSFVECSDDHHNKSINGSTRLDCLLVSCNQITVEFNYSPRLLEDFVENTVLILEILNDRR